MRIGIVLFDQVDLLDVGGPYEVLLTASRLARRDGAPEPFEVVTVGLTTATVVAYGGLGLVPQLALADASGLDLLVIPGAVEIDRVLDDRALIDALGAVAGAVPLVASVCTGAFILQALGLLAERDWTTHWEDIDALTRQARRPGSTRVRWVDSDEVITSGGLSSGIAMALHLVDRFAGRELALRTACQLEYDWDPSGAVAPSRSPGANPG
jgi:transcriptional regulator GlxA family with amidase domain